MSWAGGDSQQNADNSLRGKALSRALDGELPRTLTPYEWEQWYAEHGTPVAHCQAGVDEPKSPSWFHRVVMLVRRVTSKR